MNFYKPNADYYYHLALVSKNKVDILIKNERNKDTVKEYVLNHLNNKKFKVIATLETLESMVDYINRKDICDGIIDIYAFNEEDAFKSENTIFVDCTDDFKNISK